MDLLEHQGKQLFGRHGLAVSDGKAVTTVEDAVAAANEIGYPVVVKAQVLIGGRGKAGGVKLAADEAEAREHATNILGLDIKGHIVRTVWIEAASDIATEYYAAVLLDRGAKKPLVMFSSEGGIEIETVAEINPLIVTPDRQVKALDAKVTLDDNAMFRHKENAELGDSANADPIELKAHEQDVIYVKLDGDIGIMGNGAGLVMSTLDVVAQYDGKPANFLDAGGGSDAAKVTQAIELILSNPAVKAVLLNIFGGITRCDEVAKGLVEAFAQLKPTVPFVVRLDGTNDVEGRKILEDAALPNVHAAKTMDGAAELVVKLAKENA
jgi:succinyl-CoA synthetase beta subunit